MIISYWNPLQRENQSQTFVLFIGLTIIVETLHHRQASAFVVGRGRRCTNHFAFFETGREVGMIFHPGLLFTNINTMFHGEKLSLVICGENVQVFEWCLTCRNEGSLLIENMIVTVFLLHVKNIYPCINYTLHWVWQKRQIYISHPNTVIHNNVRDMFFCIVSSCDKDPMKSWNVVRVGRIQLLTKPLCLGDIH